jgi:hypothetical protein
MMISGRCADSAANTGDPTLTTAMEASPSC